MHKLLEIQEHIMDPDIVPKTRAENMRSSLLKNDAGLASGQVVNGGGGGGGGAGPRRSVLTDPQDAHLGENLPLWTRPQFGEAQPVVCGSVGNFFYNLFAANEEDGERGEGTGGKASNAADHPMHNLFWAGKLGPQFHVFIVRLLLLCFALYTTLFLLEVGT